MKTAWILTRLACIALLLSFASLPPGLGHVTAGASLASRGTQHTEKLPHLPSAATKGVPAHSEKSKIDEKDGSGEVCALDGPCVTSFAANKRVQPSAREASADSQSELVSSRRGRTNSEASSRLSSKRCAGHGASARPGCKAVLASVQIGGQSLDADTFQDTDPISVFGEADRNGDGVVDLREVVRVVNALLGDIAPPEDDLFSTLQQDWLSAASSEDREFVAELVRHFDEDADGVLHVGEFSPFLLTFYSTKGVGQTALMLLFMKHREAREVNLWGHTIFETLLPKGARDALKTLQKPGQLSFKEAKLALQTVQQQHLAEAEEEVTNQLLRLDELQGQRGPSPAIDEARARKVREFYAYRALVKKGQKARMALPDKDGDGAYDLLELIALLEAEIEYMGVCVVFVSFDVNGDGRLSMKEARAIAEEATSWAVLDANGKLVAAKRGLPTTGEKARYYREDREASPREKREEICTFCWILDANKDRYVTLDEFAYFMHNEDLVAAGLRAMLRRNRDVVQF